MATAPGRRRPALACQDCGPGTGAGSGSGLACSVLTAAGCHSSRAAEEIGNRARVETLSMRSSSREVASAARECVTGGAAGVCLPRAAAAGGSLPDTSELEKDRPALVVLRVELAYGCCCIAAAAAAEGELVALGVWVSGRRRGELGCSNSASCRGSAKQPKYDQSITGRHTLSGSANLQFGQPNALEGFRSGWEEGERRTQAGHLG